MAPARGAAGRGGGDAPRAARFAAGSAVLYSLDAVDAIDDFRWPIGVIDDGLAVALAEAAVRQAVGREERVKNRRALACPGTCSL